MRLTLVVCGFLLGLTLAPIDGRLKYAEVLPRETFQKLLLPSPDGYLEEHEPDTSHTMKGKALSSVGNKVTATRHGTNGRDEATPAVATPAADGGHRPSSLNCFPLADQQHKYDWARYYLRHMVAGSPDYGDGDKPADSILPGKAPRKRSDFNREISVDLYAQYPSSCACQTKYELLDLGYTHFPRYIVNAICQNRSANSRKCWRGSSCKEIPYKVRVLTTRTDNESGEQDHHSTLLPEPLREYWRFKTVTIAAACQCSI